MTMLMKIDRAVLIASGRLLGDGDQCDDHNEIHNDTHENGYQPWDGDDHDHHCHRNDGSDVVVKFVLHNAYRHCDSNAERG